MNETNRIHPYKKIFEVNEFQRKIYQKIISFRFFLS